MTRSRASLRGRVELVAAGALLCGLVLAYPAVTGVQIVLGSFVADEICPSHTYCGNPWPAVGWLAGLVTLTGLVLWGRRAVARWAVRPLPDMATTIGQLGPRNLGQRLRLDDVDEELRVLASAVNDMLNRVAAGFEGQRRFASNASHELRTPLAVQRTLVEVAMITGDGKDPEVNRLAKQLLVVNERNERLIEGLLVLAEADRGLPGTVPVRLDELAASVLTAYADRLAEHDLTLHRDLTPRTVRGDPVLLERMIGNLVHNAIKYNDPGGRIEVVVADEPAFSVHNTGQRVPAESVTALFEPFRRLSADRTNHRDGAGLGLSIVRSIATAHGGTAAAAPGDEGGLRVTVSLPLISPESSAENE
ncbi:sensor histidine kinase [Amycolatopsis pigmentata]|uniref:histidine kinase n=1 Tax=Amycolatopsis pigmentata TaxID=450801 RepID=A0ABW5FR40_9PSEU